MEPGELLDQFSQMKSYLAFPLLLSGMVISQAQSSSVGVATNRPPAVSKPGAAAQTASPRRVGVDEFDMLRHQSNTVVLDVRTAREFGAGHIPGATNLDYNGPDFAKTVSVLDRSRPYLVHCAAGGRSARASRVMWQLGFTNIVDLAPGFRAWEKAGKPVEK